MDATKLIAAAVEPMFREPDSTSEQVSQALLGTPVTVIAGGGEWSYVRTPDTYQGWVAASSLVDAPAGWDEPWAEVEDLWVNLRCAPSSQKAAAAHATIGVRLPKLRGTEGWTELLLPDGRRLWTEAHRVVSVDDEPLRPRTRGALRRTALRFLGIPYLWGGCSTAGLDCSGFVQLVMRLHGIELLRDADMQATQGEPCDDPTTGDLVFFGPSSRPEAITHVGMMLNRRRYINAVGTDRVRIDRLASESAIRQVRCARSYLPAERLTSLGR